MWVCSQSGSIEAEVCFPGLEPVLDFSWLQGCMETQKGHLHLFFSQPVVHEQSLQDMLRKARQQQQYNREAKQRNTTRPNSHFSEKNWVPQVGFEPTAISFPGDTLTN